MCAGASPEICPTIDRKSAAAVNVLAVGGDLRRSERCLAGARGRTSKLTIYVDLNIGSPGGPGSWFGSVGSGGAHWGGL